MTTEQTASTMDQYFDAMGRAEDFSVFFTEDVSWLMVDSGQEVRGAGAVKDYIFDLHSRMFSQEQVHDIVVTEHNAYVEGEAVNAVEGASRGLVYCIVYEFAGARIDAMRCYGSIASLMLI